MRGSVRGTDRTGAKNRLKSDLLKGIRNNPAVKDFTWRDFRFVEEATRFTRGFLAAGAKA